MKLITDDKNRIITILRFALKIREMHLEILPISLEHQEVF